MVEDSIKQLGSENPRKAAEEFIQINYRHPGPEGPHTQPDCRGRAMASWHHGITGEDLMAPTD